MHHCRWSQSIRKEKENLIIFISSLNIYLILSIQRSGI
jgi:hypothetical protein